MYTVHTYERTICTQHCMMWIYAPLVCTISSFLDTVYYFLVEGALTISYFLAESFWQKSMYSLVLVIFVLNVWQANHYQCHVTLYFQIGLLLQVIYLVNECIILVLLSQCCLHAELTRCKDFLACLQSINVIFEPSFERNEQWLFGI